MKRALAIAAFLCLVVGVVVLLLRQLGDSQSDAGRDGSAATPSGEPSRDAVRDGSKREEQGSRTLEERDQVERNEAVAFSDTSRWVGLSLEGEPWQAEVFRAAASAMCEPGVLPGDREYGGAHFHILESEATDVVGLDSTVGLRFKSAPRAREVHIEPTDDSKALLRERLAPWTVPTDVERANPRQWTRTPAALYLHRDDCEWAVDGEPPPGREYGATCEFIPDIPGCNAK